MQRAYVDVLFDTELQSKDNTESIHTSLQNILEDPENGTIDNTLPPSLLVILEKVRTTLQDQKEAISKSTQQSKASIEEAQHGTYISQHV